MDFFGNFQLFEEIIVHEREYEEQMFDFMNVQEQLLMKNLRVKLM